MSANKVGQSRDRISDHGVGRKALATETQVLTEVNPLRLGERG